GAGSPPKGRGPRVIFDLIDSGISRRTEGRPVLRGGRQMSEKQRLRGWILAGVGLVCLMPVLRAATPAEPEQKPQDPEGQIRQEVFNELKGKGEIIESSPLYDALMPVIEPIMQAAQPKYPHPFKVYIVHEAQPNAFATPGGNIYVVDSLLYFVKNKEQ